MMNERKYWVPVVIVLCLALGFVSATLLARYNFFVANRINIFKSTTNDCPNLIWTGNADTTQSARPISVTGELFFAGEQVPLQDPEVRERLERELQLNSYWHSNTLMSMKLANRYFPDLEKILAENNVPTDFKYLALIESGFRNDASPSGAVGFWQFLKETAKGYGLEVNDEVDERYNYEKSTVAACKYLTEAKASFGSWTTAAASYNMGMNGMASRINDQKTNYYYDMYFNPETSRYIFRMLAMKIIFSNPKRAGFDVRDEELYQPYKYTAVQLDSSIRNIADFAAGYNLKYKHIKMLNPWLRNAKLTNKERRTYSVKILDSN